MDYTQAIIHALMSPASQYEAPAGQVDPRIQWYRAGANTDEAMGFNALQKMTGINLSPRVPISGMFAPELSPQNRIQETFRSLPGYF